MSFNYCTWSSVAAWSAIFVIGKQILMPISCNGYGVQPYSTTHTSLLARMLCSPRYNEFKRARVGGYGGLFSVLFHQDACARVFYDNLETAKGPGFGSNFTLVCP
jgi:hypothetical protein